MKKSRLIESLESRSYLSAAAPAVSSAVLVNAATDQAIGLFANASKLDVSIGNAYSVEAKVPAGTKSVRFDLDGQTLLTENYAPFTIAGDAAGDFHDWIPAVGSHILQVIPYAGLSASGLAGQAVTVHFDAVATTLPPIVTRAIHPLGGNLDTMSDRVQDLAFVDLVKTTRGFYNTAGRKASNGATAFANRDANGWPTEDFSFSAVDNTEWNVPVATGSYAYSFKGPTGVQVSAVAGVTVSALAFNATTGIYTGSVTVGAGVLKLSLTFKSTKGQVKNIRLLQPGYALSSTQTFTTKYITLLTTVNPTVLRFMNFTQTNNNPEVNWADRPKVTDATQALDAVAGGLQPLKGVAWDYVIQLANQLNKDVWINVPAQASDDYVTQLATQFRNQLNAGLKIYLEYSNEVWNSGFTQSGYNKGQAVSEVFANANSNLNYDHKPVDKTKPGSSNPQADTWGDRRYARRTQQIATIFKNVFIAGGKGDPINTRVRVVLDGQVANLSRFDNELAYLSKFYGAPKTFLWGIGIAPYFNVGKYSTTPGATKAQILAALDSSVNGYINGKSLSNSFQKASAFGLKLLGYEGGSDTFGAANIAAKRDASLDPQMQTILTKYLNNWYAKGGDLFNYFTIGARSHNSPYGTWTITESLDVLNSPKIKAFQQVRG